LSPIGKNSQVRRSSYANPLPEAQRVTTHRQKSVLPADMQWSTTQGMAIRTPAVQLFRLNSPLNWEDSEARPAGFEPATRCLEGTVQGSRQVAWRRPTRRSTAGTVARGRVVSPGACRRWLPVWLPQPVCPARFKRLKTIASMAPVPTASANQASVESLLSRSSLMWLLPIRDHHPGQRLVGAPPAQRRWSQGS